MRHGLGGSVTELVAVQIRKAAELLTMAEGIRAGALGGTPQTSGDLTALIRIEGEARRALRALGLKIEPAPRLSQWPTRRLGPARRWNRRWLHRWRPFFRQSPSVATGFSNGPNPNLRMIGPLDSYGQRRHL